MAMVSLWTWFTHPGEDTTNPHWQNEVHFKDWDWLVQICRWLSRNHCWNQIQTVWEQPATDWMKAASALHYLFPSTVTQQEQLVLFLQLDLSSAGCIQIWCYCADGSTHWITFNTKTRTRKTLNWQSTNWSWPIWGRWSWWSWSWGSCPKLQLQWLMQWGQWQSSIYSPEKTTVVITADALKVVKTNEIRIAETVVTTAAVAVSQGLL